MHDSTTVDSVTALFGEVISTYSRAQALEDGVLVDAGAMAREIGFRFHVALTEAAWSDCVAWTDADSEAQVHQDQTGRLFDVLFMARHAIRSSRNETNRLMMQLNRVPRDGQSTEAVVTTLKLIVGPGDNAEPVITILMTDED
jgi:type I site-specific restriction endonuclease